MVVNLNYVCVLYLICAKIVFAIDRSVQPLPSSNKAGLSAADESTIHHEAASVTKPMPSTPTNTSEVTTQIIHINHNRTAVTAKMVPSTTLATPTTTTTTINHPTSTPGSEVSDMTNHITHNGSPDLGDIGKGNHSDHSPKEDSKSKHTTSSSNTTNKVEALSTTISPPRTNSVSIPMEVKSVNTSTRAAGIAAIVCVGIASAAFLSLFAWRYMYRKRHGNREILINEEDVEFNDEDLRHFEATSIQLEPEA